MEKNGKSCMVILGKCVVFSVLQFSLASTEMSSKSSIKNSDRDQESLQHSADALSNYIKISILWMLVGGFLFYCNYKWY